ncbi:MAG: hypothetical protein ACJATA_001495 [Sphingobacteriales bacterium]|jgi:hypothetical protein
MEKDLKVNRPSIISASKSIKEFNPSDEVGVSIKLLESGNQVLITEFYSHGLTLLKALHVHLKKKFPGKSFQEKREYRGEFQKLSNLILLEFVDHKFVVGKAPNIGWIEKLFPEETDFHLALPQVQGLNSSWQWYKNGISIPVLRNKLHPYYGVYFPTRFEHLTLFDNWLKRYKGEKKTAIDVGVGCGVLSFQLLKHGFQTVYGTDSNPNAIVGLSEFMADTKLSRKVELDFGDLFGKWDNPAELIVFNPPWLPESVVNDGMDEAIFYNDKLFPEFFEGAAERLLPDGKIVVLFSNLAQLTKLTEDHPIEKELAEGGRFVLEKHLKKSVLPASTATKRVQSWRAEEKVEIWVLVQKKI